ncbi:helix-turn-helix domain-containing protein [Nocardia puris]|nr:helix-turn-helix domain-containing protein [Nocardia puris]MBF6213975.1 helix-turn-helix domain-containing protein [Nocardia puris]MBF6368729.1 helix-turn-helix domain-containing protein [Nocardia puris]MBF6461644.1 helix-turn-helix domain-containing protein [Nocardia puris]
MSEMTTSQAAELLGVTPRQVARMASSGRIDVARRVGRTLLVDAGSVHRLVRQRRHPGRIWTQRTAWSALSLLSGSDPVWASSAERTRLIHRLRRMAPEELTHLSANRAVVHRFRGDSEATHDLPNYIAVTGSSATRHPLWQRFELTSEPTGVDGYVPASELEPLVDHFHLVPDPAGEIALRTTTFESAFLGGHTPWAAVAVDLTESLDTRESRAGHNELTELLERMRQHDR